LAALAEIGAAIADVGVFLEPWALGDLGEILANLVAIPFARPAFAFP